MYPLGRILGTQVPGILNPRKTVPENYRQTPGQIRRIMAEIQVC